jgi:hypothetical protein
MSASLKKEILPFGKMWMKLKDILVSEISQIKTNITGSQLYMQCQNIKLLKA